jgi:hypothetical protein
MEVQMSIVKEETEALMTIGTTCTLFRDQRNEAFAQSPDGDLRCMKIATDRFKTWLRSRYYAKFKAAVTSPTALSNAVLTLSAMAESQDKRFDLDLRFSRAPGEVWLDLCRDDGNMVRVTRDGWTVEPHGTPRFRRSDHMRELPLPLTGGRATELARFFNLQHDDEVLLLPWIVLGLFPGIARPILALIGTQGAAKSTAARMIRSLVDPSAGDLLAPRRNEQEFAQILDHHAVPTFDNLGKITPHQSDAFCRAVTGGTFSKRKLRTDDDDVIFAFKRPIIVTAVNLPGSAPDLVDRFLALELRRISQTDRKQEESLWAEFEQARPLLLGGLLNAVAGTLALVDEVQIDRPERMADFMRVGAAAAQALGYGRERFEEAYRRSCKALLGDAADADAVSVCIRKFAAHEHGNWEGTATELLTRLHAIAGAFEVKGLPGNAAELGKRVRYLIPALRSEGVEIDTRVLHGRDGRRIAISGLAVRDQLPAHLGGRSFLPADATLATA